MSKTPIYFFTEHAEQCLEGNGLSEFGIRTAIAKGVNFNAERFSDHVKAKIIEFREASSKTVYVSPDPKTWITATLMYYPYTSGNAKLTLKISKLLAADKQKKDHNNGYFFDFLKKYEFMNVEVQLVEDNGEWGLEPFMLSANYPFVACVTHRTTMQAYVSKMKDMDKQIYDSFKSMWSMAVDYDNFTIEIQEGVKTSEKGNCLDSHSPNVSIKYEITK